MSSKQYATIAPSANGGFAVIAANGELLQDGFKSRGHAAMWAARKGIYRSSAPPKHKTEIPIPDALADERIFPIGILRQPPESELRVVLAGSQSRQVGHVNPNYGSHPGNSLGRLSAERSRARGGQIARISKRHRAVIRCRSAFLRPSFGQEIRSTL
jgi:hypothetical protein